MGRPKGSKNKNTPVKENKRKVIAIKNIIIFFMFNISLVPG